jgi:hypothetical protein
MNVWKRFARSTRIFRWFLFIVGLPDSSPGKYYWIKRFWKVFFYLLALQGNIYIFIDRSYRYMDFSLITDIDVLLTIFNRLHRILGNISLHTLLFLKLESIMSSFFCNLEIVDFQLRQPNFSSVISYSTIIGMIWILLTVSNLSLNSWLVQHLTNPIDFRVTLQQFVQFTGKFSNRNLNSLTGIVVWINSFESRQVLWLLRFKYKYSIAYPSRIIS